MRLRLELISTSWQIEFNLLQSRIQIIGLCREELAVVGVAARHHAIRVDDFIRVLRLNGLISRYLEAIILVVDRLQWDFGGLRFAVAGSSLRMANKRQIDNNRVDFFRKKEGRRSIPP